jgi:hypothetical protein
MSCDLGDRRVHPKAQGVWLGVNTIPESIQLLSAPVERILAIPIKAIEVDLGPIEVHDPSAWRSFVRARLELLCKLAQRPSGLGDGVLYKATFCRSKEARGPIMGRGPLPVLLRHDGAQGMGAGEGRHPKYCSLGELSEVKFDGWEASQALCTPSRRRMKRSCDPASSFTLHTGQLFERAFVFGALEVLEAARGKAVRSAQTQTQTQTRKGPEKP